MVVFSKESSAETGFTLLELLITIVIIGIVSAIALPSFLNQRTKSQETEAKILISTMNRAQQAHYSVYQNFAASLAELELGISNQMNVYDYDVAPSADGRAVTNRGRSRNADLRGYAGIVAYTQTSGTSIICQATKRGTDAIETVTTGTTAQCPRGYQQMQ